MPFLATLLSSLFGAAFSFFAKYFVMDKAARLAAVTVMLSLATALYTALYSCIQGVCAVAIGAIGAAHEFIGVGLGVAINTVTLSAVGCYMTVWIVCQLYVIKKKAINIFMGSN